MRTFGRGSCSSLVPIVETESDENGEAQDEYEYMLQFTRSDCGN